MTVSLNQKLAVLFMVLSFLIPRVLIAEVMTSTTYQLRFDSANSGGGLVTSSSYVLEDTIGEVASGRSGSAPGDWFDSDWLYRVKITINADQVTSTLSDFPLYVDLAHLPDDFFSHVKTDGSDIRTLEGDGTTETPFELVALDTGGQTGELHVLIDSLSSSLDTDFYIYYGNSAAAAHAATDTYGSDNVWSDYVFVHHFQETPAGADSVLDSSGNGNDGTPNSMTSANLSVGQLAGNAYYFAGDSGADYVNLGNSNLLSGGGPFTISAWAKYDTLPVAGGDSARTIAGEYWSDSNYRENIFEIVSIENVVQQRFIVWNSSDASSFATGTKTDWATSTWYHHSVSVDAGDNVSLYVDGVQDGSTVAFSNYWYAGSASMYLGAVMRASTTPDGEHHGGLDEVRISSLERSDAWLATEYFNQKYPLVFYSVHREEEQFGTYVLNAGFQQMKETSLSLSVVNDVILQPGIGLATPNSVGWDTFRVFTDNAAGYNLYVKTSQDPALQHTLTGSNFSDYTPATPGTPESWAVDSGQSQFGYSAFDGAGGDVNDSSWGAADDCGDPATGDPDIAGGDEQLYDGLSISNRLVAQRTTRTDQSGSLITLCFAAGTNGGGVEAGDYVAPITITAIAL